MYLINMGTSSLLYSQCVFPYVYYFSLNVSNNFLVSSCDLVFYITYYIMFAKLCKVANIKIHKEKKGG